MGLWGLWGNERATRLLNGRMSECLVQRLLPLLFGLLFDHCREKAGVGLAVPFQDFAIQGSRVARASEKMWECHAATAGCEVCLRSVPLRCTIH